MLSGVTATEPTAEDIALILHTSGSTGRPKRVPLRHFNLAVSSANIANTYALSEEDVSLCIMPLFHIHGLIASTMATLLSGGAVVVPTKFNALSFWRRCGSIRRRTSPTLRALSGRCFAVHHAAVPRPRVDCLNHGNFAYRRSRGCSHQVQRAFFLADGAGASRHLVFGSAHDASASAGSDSPQAGGS